ncbi:MAG: Fe-S cluster assembly protein SufD, partial [Pseudomonadota bacterium]|nr:Fe-S cluster assembly protein SufD [Pseudomonadota bacterium]
MPKQPTIVDSFPQQFAEVKFDLLGSGLAWLDDRREAGIEAFSNLGLPTPRLEEWKYTRLQSLEDTQFRSAWADDANAVVDLIPAMLPADPERLRLVFVNGFLRRDLSITGCLPDGATVESLTESLERDTGWVETHMGGAIENDEHALLALNTAMMNSGVVIHIRPDVIVSKPIEILFMTGLTDAPVAYHPRNLIVMDEGSQATLVKHYVGAGVGAYLTNTVTEISVGPGAV